MAAVRALVLCLIACILGVSAQTATCPAVGCGNGICDFGTENCQNCPSDCGLCPTCEGICGNQLCEKTALESSCNCPVDCGLCCVDGLCRGLENAINCPSDCTGNLIGSVYDLDTLDNIANASVVCTTRFSTFNAGTDVNGFFGLGGLAGDTYTCTASKDGYLPNSNSFNFFPGSSFRVNNTIRIGIRMPPAMIVGRVTDAVGKFNIRGANVSCAINGAYTVKYTDRIGTYFMHDLKPGFASCQAGADGYNLAYNNGTAVRGIAVEIDFVLIPKPTGILGKVIDRSTGLPLPGAAINCWASKDRSQLPNSTTDSVGAFSYFNLLDIEYMCTSTLVGYTRGKGFVCPPKGKNGTLLLKMTPLPAVLQGTVYDQVTGAPLFNAPVNCIATGYSGATTTFRDGSWSLGKVQPGTYFCNATYPLYFPAYNFVKTVTPGQVGVINFPLQFPPSNLSGVVSIVTYQGVSTANGATVTCSFNGTTLTTTTAADGSYSFLSVALGAANCTASLTDFTPSNKGVTILRSTNHTLNFQLVEIKGDLIVIVVEQTSNNRISGAAVKCVSSVPTLLATTDVNGTTRFPAVPPVSYSCNATAFGYAEGFAPATLVPRNQVTVITIVLTPLPGILLVQVVDNTTGNAIGQALTTVTPGSLAAQTADGNGGTQWIVAAGTYTAGASATGYTSGSTSGIIVLKGQTTTAVVRLNPIPGSLTVNVLVLVSGVTSPLPGATVTTSGGVSFSVTDIASSASASLSYVITQFGSYSATASISGYTPNGPFPAPVAVGRNGSAVINLVFIPLPGGVTVQVVDDSNSNPITGASVVITPATQFTDGNGWTVWNLTAGTYVAQCSAAGYVSNQTGPIVVTRAGNSTAQCRLVPIPGVLFVNVVDDATNLPLPGANIQVAGESVTFTGFAAVTAPSPNANASYTITVYGTYRATATLSGYNSDSRVSVAISRNQTASITLRLVVIPNIVNVEIRDNRTRALIPGAGVTFTGQAARTAADGTTSYTGIAAGTYTVGGSAAGYISNSTSTGALTRNQTVTIVIFLVEQPCIVNVLTLNQRTLLAVANATVTINDALSSNGLTNAFGFITFSILYDAANNVSASKFGFNDNFTAFNPVCSRGANITITIILQEVLNLRIAARDVASPSQPFITTANISWNGVLLTKSDPSAPYFRVLTVTTLPQSGTCFATARGFNDKTTTYTFTENTSRDLIVSLAPQDFTLFFVPQEVVVSGANTSTAAPLAVDYTGQIQSNYNEVIPGIASSEVLRTNQPITLGGFAVQVSNPNVSRSYVANTTVFSIDGVTNLGTYFAAKFQNIVPTALNAFYLSLTTDLDNMIVNRNSTTNSSVLINVPAYGAIAERSLIFFVPYVLNAGFVEVRVFGVNAAKNAFQAFGPNDFVTSTLGTSRFSNYPAVGGYKVAVFEYGLTFGEAVSSITISFPTESYSSTLSGWADPESALTSFTTVAAGSAAETSIISFSFTKQTPGGGSLFVPIPGAGQVARDATKKLYVVKDYLLVALKKKRENL